MKCDLLFTIVTNKQTYADKTQKVMIFHVFIECTHWTFLVMVEKLSDSASDVTKCHPESGIGKP